MTGPRSCRECGIALNPDIRWCTRCYAQAIEFAPRERQLPPRTDHEPIPEEAIRKHHMWVRIHKPAYSRVR